MNSTLRGPNGKPLTKKQIKALANRSKFIRVIPSHEWANYRASSAQEHVFDDKGRRLK